MFCRAHGHFQCVFALLAALLFLPAHPAAAGPFLLPDDAVIAVSEFSFPATADASAAHELPTLFHSQLALALQQAGITVYRGESPAIAAENSAPPVAAPPEEPREGETAEGDALPVSGKEAAPLAPIPLEEPLDGETAMDDALPALSGPDGAASGTMPEGGNSPEETPPAASSGEHHAATHILEGTVTLFRETVGAPSRIAGTVRIRVESRLRCAYTLKDAVTGKALVADDATGSAALLARENHDYNALLHSLRARAMAAAAERLAVRLSGTDSSGDAASDRSYYQDSPGKRLKVRQ